MNIFRKAYCRLYQGALYVGMAFMPWREPQILSGEDSFVNAVEFMSRHGVKRPLIVCDKPALERGALNPFFDAAKGMLDYAVYDGVLPNPTVEQVEQGLGIYKSRNCDGILAFGGGSAMDCAKAIGARVVRPKKTVNQMKGLLKVGRRLPPLFAVPTTAGTGSECTVAAVITDGETHLKYAINDFNLIPHYAIHDAKLTQSLPPFLTATTGMDALTHAVEAYIGRGNTRKTKRCAEQAVKLIFDNLEQATVDGANLVARSRMLEASYLAGLAFTRAYVGYVHALAHALGGKYGIAHGYANAVLLPAVLDVYGKSACKPLARLAKIIGVADKSDKAGVAGDKFGRAVRELNAKLNVPATFDGKIEEKDFDELAKRADREANPLYPVPKLLNARELKQIYYKVM